jgi:hypothetical protein
MTRPSRPHGGIPGELFRLVTRIVGGGVVAVVGLSLAAFAISFGMALLSLLVRGVAGEEAARGILGVFPNLIGLVVLVGLLRFVLLAHGRMWRCVSDVYGASPGDPPRVRRFPEQAVISGGGLAFRRYVPLTVGIHARGLSLKLAPPFSIGCPPIFLPFDEMNIRPSSWYVWGEAWGIRAAKADHIEIVIGNKFLDWMRTHCPAGTIEAAKSRGLGA